MLVWIRLSGLSVDYCSNATLTKNTKLIGTLLKADTTTINKEYMTYVRALMEMPLDKVYPTDVIFENEHGKIA